MRADNDGHIADRLHGSHSHWTCTQSGKWVTPGTSPDRGTTAVHEGADGPGCTNEAAEMRRCQIWCDHQTREHERVVMQRSGSVPHCAGRLITSRSNHLCDCGCDVPEWVCHGGYFFTQTFFEHVLADSDLIPNDLRG